MIEVVHAASNAQDVSSVYWSTQGFNKPALRLYDCIEFVTAFSKYQRRQALFADL